MADTDTDHIACPVCGYLTLTHRGGFEICDVCFWEDEGDMVEDPDKPTYGPNGDLSLNNAKQNYKKFGACSEDMKVYTREPLPDEYPEK